MSASELWPLSVSERQMCKDSDDGDLCPADRGRCPLRHFREIPIAKVLDDLTRRLHQMPPDHNLLMAKFQENEELRKELDARFGNDKTQLLSYLFETHKTHFARDAGGPRSKERLEIWLDGLVEEPEEGMPKDYVSHAVPKDSRQMPWRPDSEGNTVKVGPKTI